MKHNIQENFKKLLLPRKKKNDVVDTFAKNKFKFLQNNEERWNIM